MEELDQLEMNYKSRTHWRHHKRFNYKQVTNPMGTKNKKKKKIKKLKKKAHQLVERWIKMGEITIEIKDDNGTGTIS